MTFGVVVTWSAGFYGSRQYTIKADSSQEAETEGLELAWNELKDLDISKRWNLRQTQLSVVSARLNEEGTGRYVKLNEKS